MLRIRADDPSALCQLGVKFGCTVDEGKKLLLRARDMELCVVGIRYVVGTADNKFRTYSLNQGASSIY